MSQPASNDIGRVVSILRYPVKSMMGEELNTAAVAARGLVGDRAYAILDTAEGKVASAKNPRKWPDLFDYRAAFTDEPRVAAKLPSVRITLPGGSMITSDERDASRVLSGALGREVSLSATEARHEERATAEEYWPDMEGLDYRDTVTDFDLPEGTFFDCAVIHVLTTATIDRLRELYPEGRFEVRRFRPNIVVEPTGGMKDFVENAWIGRTLAIGETVRLSVTGPCPRCVMTTLPQGDLPRDPGILRAAAQHNSANVGVYASVLSGGELHRGDPARIE